MKQPAVHVSEIKTFLKCRLAWFWSAPPPRGLGLEPKTSATALSFGRLIHLALQHGYDKKTPFYEEYVRLCGEEQQDDIPDYQKQVDLGVTMLKGYQRWAEPKDVDTQFLALETVWNTRTPEGRLIAGRFDAPVSRSGDLWVLDFKTTSYLSNDWTSRDLQATVYTYAARQLFGKAVRGLLFRFLLKKAPTSYADLILKKGTLTARKDLSRITPYEEWAKAMAVATLQDLVKNNPTFAEQVALEYGTPLCDYMALLDGSQGEKEWYPAFNEAHRQVRRMYDAQTMTVKGASNFFWDVEEDRTDKQIKSCFKYVIDPAVREMTSRRKGRWVGPTGLGTAFHSCGRCPFRYPCKLVLDGADYKAILKEEFRLQERYK